MPTTSQRPAWVQHMAPVTNRRQSVRRGREEGGRLVTGSLGVAPRATERTEKDRVGGGRVWRLGRRGLGEWIAHARDGPTRLRWSCGLSVHLSPHGWLRPTLYGATVTKSHLWLALAHAQLISSKTDYWSPKTSDELVRPREPFRHPYLYPQPCDAILEALAD